MLLKVDEDLPTAAVEMLRAAGHDAPSVRDQEMGGWKDQPIWDAIQRESRFLVTADKGFTDIRIHPPGTHFGVLLLRPDEDGVDPILALLSAFFGILPSRFTRSLRGRRDSSRYPRPPPTGIGTG